MEGRRRRWLAFWLLVWATALGAQPQTLPTGVVQRILTILRKADLQGGWLGLVVAQQGRPGFLLARNPDQAFMPASNMKLVTTAAALSVLGADFRFSTQVAAVTPFPSGGVLQGDLYLIGGADPSLDFEHLEKLARQLAAQGLREVRGGVVGDGSLLSGPRWGYGWNWDDLPWYYAPELSGLCLHRNQITLSAKPGERLGDPVQILVEPETTYLSIERKALTGPVDAGDEFTIWRDPGESVLHLTGFLPLGSPGVRQACSVPQPALFAAHTWTAMLKKAGIRVARPARIGQAPRQVSVWLTHQSPPLRELLRQLNKWSDNLYAEQIFRMVGIASGEGPEPQDARNAVHHFLQRNGFSVNALRVADGSGLSRFNLVTPRLLAEVLQWLAKHPDREAILDSLPVAGKEGTLAGRLRGTAAEGNLRAKTGTLGNVRCLAGYLTSADGTPLIVVCLVNHYTCPLEVVLGLQDGICQALAECRRGRGKEQAFDEFHPSAMSRAARIHGHRTVTVVPAVRVLTGPSACSSGRPTSG